MFLKKILLLSVLVNSICAEEPIPRDVLAFYWPSKEEEEESNPSYAEQYAELPLNHLGINMIPYNLKKGLPDFSKYKNLRGVLLWFGYSVKMENIDGFISGIDSLIKEGVKFVSMGELGFPSDDPLQNNAGASRTDFLLGTVGLKFEGGWVTKTYKSEFIVEKPLFYNFENKLGDELPDYMIWEPLDDSVIPIVTAKNSEASAKSSLIAAMHPRGGVVMPGYAVFNKQVGDKYTKGWYLNPFLFFKECYKTEDLPKPDTTTIAGRRILYSQLDGDGWNNVSLVPNFYQQGKYSAEVIYQEICLAYPDFPITIGMIGAEVDFDWYATKEIVEIGKNMYKLPHIEVSTHTFTHPFYWAFFKNYSPAKEAPYFSRYPQGGWDNSISSETFYERMWRILTGKKSSKNQKLYINPADFSEGLAAYDTPRYYAKEPFSLELEINGAIDIMKLVAPINKFCALYQWSGDCLPFEEAVKLTRLANIPNINGGDTRFDSKFPSYSEVAPIGRAVGSERQIYASNSNENTYTNDWTSEYFGFQLLKETFINTEMPFRIKPMDVYFHAYSGERLASLNALKKNIDFALSQNQCSIRASEFSKIAQGFYTTQFYLVEEKGYRVANRGALQTIRFDDALFKGVDFDRSTGIVGQRHFQGSLYVYLDKKVDEPVIFIKESDEIAQEPRAQIPYLIESSWLVFDLKRDQKELHFQTTGFGKGTMRWSMPTEGLYKVVYPGGEMEVSTKNHQLEFTVPVSGIDPINVVIINIYI